MKIGERIRRRRSKLGLSLRELGALTNLTAGFLSQIENDQTFLSIDSLQEIFTHRADVVALHSSRTHNLSR